MKKIILFVCCLSLVFCLALSASAADYRELGYNGSVLGVDGGGDEVIYDFFDFMEAHGVSDAVIVGSNLYILLDEGQFKYQNGKLVLFHEEGFEVLHQMYKYNKTDGYWYWAAEDLWSSGSALTSNMSDVKWSYFDIKDDSGNVVFEGEKSFYSSPPTYEEAVDEAIQNTYADFLSVVGTLVVVGVGILGTILLLHLLRKKSILHI